MGTAASCSRSIRHTLAWAFPHEIFRLSRDLSSPSLHQGRYMLQRPGRLIAVGMENIEWILSVKSLPYVLHAEEPSYISSCFYWMGEVYQWIVHPVPTLGFSSLPRTWHETQLQTTRNEWISETQRSSHLSTLSAHEVGIWPVSQHPLNRHLLLSFLLLSTDRCFLPVLCLYPATETSSTSSVTSEYNCSCFLCFVVFSLYSTWFPQLLKLPWASWFYLVRALLLPAKMWLHYLLCFLFYPMTKFHAQD